MQAIHDLTSAYLAYAWSIATYPLDPSRRLYVAYLLTSTIAAFAVYRVMVRRGQVEEGSFLRFLFPRQVWQHPSAWLDLRYFVFHMLIGHFVLLGVGASAAALSFGLITGAYSGTGFSLDDFTATAGTFSAGDLGIATAFMFVSFAVVDFLAWYLHYLQHKWPILWQFHKVHHSAEVMHPVSNFREHPVDNLTYGLIIGLGFGAVNGLAVDLFGYLPSVPSLLGVPVLMLVFNLLAYNLRHSHVWLRWPGRWSMVFPSPAHHHVHHSCHPDHIDKNFAFMFPIWDVIFRTYELPEDNRDVKFGIGEGKADELTSCLRLYFVPVRDAWRIARRWAAGKRRAAPGRTEFPAE